eukprot:357627-Chlamydomonas_euryale.AAC.6
MTKVCAFERKGGQAKCWHSAWHTSHLVVAMAGQFHKEFCPSVTVHPEEGALFTVHCSPFRATLLHYNMLIASCDGKCSLADLKAFTFLHASEQG